MEHNVQKNVAKLLPLKQRMSFKPEIIDKAIDLCIIECNEEGLMWNESQTLLAYFCGRMWCGDYAKMNRLSKQYQWIQGETDFPTKPVKRVFKNAGRLADLRRNRKNLTPPEGFKVIDSLFVTD